MKQLTAWIKVIYMAVFQECGARGLYWFLINVPVSKLHIESHVSVMASRCTNVLPCGLPKHNHHHVTPGHDPPPCHTYIYIDNYTDQSLTVLTTISCLLGAIQWITKMPINMFRQSRCLNTSDSICDLLKGVCEQMYLSMFHSDEKSSVNGKNLRQIHASTR